jgi:GNAT superfamily N-acetyltransferase
MREDIKMQIFSDKLLAQKIERAEARSNIDFVESHARMFPESGAVWTKIAGVYAMFDGAGSPSTQTFGLGLSNETNDPPMDELEAFFTDRKAPVFHEVSPLADPSVFPLLNERGYRPIEFTNVLYQPLEPAKLSGLSTDSPIVTRIIEPDEVDLFARTSTEGWLAEMPEYAEQMFDFSRIGANGASSIPFIAELGDEPAATGTLYISDDVAQLTGASTIPARRQQGAQTALLEARLKYASENGCTVAVMGASPGSQSQRNAEKRGFRIAYTRIKWGKESDDRNT